MEQLILGLHFGHDAHATLLQGGATLSYIQRDKITEVKSQGGVDRALIFACLADAGKTEEQIDLIAVTNTQYREFIFEDSDYFSFDYSVNHLDSLVDEGFLRNSEQGSFIETKEICDAFSRDGLDRVKCANIKQYPQLSSAFDSNTKGWRSEYVPYRFTSRKMLNQISESCVSPGDLPSFKQRSLSWAKQNCFLPILAKLKGRQIPGYLVDHHFAHSCSVAAKSPCKDSVIFSSDGSGSSVLGNLFSLKLGDTIHPFAHTSFRGGQFYELAASLLNLDCGKFMGLAGYGKSDPFFVSALDDKVLVELNHNYVKAAYEAYYGVAIDSGNLLSTANVNFAATVQSVFERSLVRYVLAIKNRVQQFVPGLNRFEFSGGTSLNCPANSILAEILGYDNIFIEPSCNDEGLGIGTCHAVENLICPILHAKHLTTSPFLGPLPSVPSVQILQECRSKAFLYDAVEASNWSDAVAGLLLDGCIGMVMRGRSEIGPRALGNRSIIALPITADISRRVNNIKNREIWRPLAPACLHEDLEEYYRGPANPFMLMTNRVVNMEFPAVTHVDGSARVQAVSKMHSNFYLILSSLKKISGKPMVVLNTSLNRKSEPILNNSDKVIDFFFGTSVDFLVLEEILITKKRLPNSMRELSLASLGPG